MITKEAICAFTSYKDVSFSAIGELEKPLTKIVGQILEDKKEYDLILGDDTSGRIPTLIAARAINTLREFEGKNKIPVRFAYNYFDGGRDIKDILKKLGKTPNRVLLVTEYIDSGFTVFNISKFFKYVGKDIEKAIILDVASVSSSYSKEHYHERGNFGEIYIGDERGP